MRLLHCSGTQLSVSPQDITLCSTICTLRSGDMGGAVVLYQTHVSAPFLPCSFSWFVFNGNVIVIICRAEQAWHVPSPVYRWGGGFSFAHSSRPAIFLFLCFRDKRALLGDSFKEFAFQNDHLGLGGVARICIHQIIIIKV